MDLISTYPIELITKIRISAEPGFSIDDFIKRHPSVITAFAKGLNDKNFPLVEDFVGATDLYLFQLQGEIFPTYKFLKSAQNNEFICVGLKGIAHMVLNHQDKLPRDSRVLSPNRPLNALDHWRESAIPYLSLGENSASLKYSNHSIMNILSGTHIILGKKIN